MRPAPVPSCAIALALLLAGAAAASELPIPEKARWEANMTTWGRKHAATLAAGREAMYPLNEAGWPGVYYDAAYVFQRIGAYTGDPSWFAAADDAIYVYRDRWIRPHDYACTPYWNFTDGMRLHWQRTGDTTSRDAVLTMAQRSFMTDWTDPAVMQPWSSSRETAYVIEGLINAKLCGGPDRTRLGVAGARALGPLHPGVVSRTPPLPRPVLVGVTPPAPPA